MEPFDRDLDSVALGDWASLEDVAATIEPTALRFHKKVRRLFNGDREDLEQSAQLALWEWWAKEGSPERVRELPAFELIEWAMSQEVRRNLKQSWGSPATNEDGLSDWGWLPNRTQLSSKQTELLDLFRMNCAKIARKPDWELTYLKRALGWSDEEVILYFRRKKDEKQRFTPDQIRKRVDRAVRKIRKKLDPSLISDVRTLDCLKLIGRPDCE